MNDVNDEYILSLILDDETQRHGFTLLVGRYHEKIYWLVRRMVIDHDDANDIVQNIFLKIWQNIRSFRGDSRLYTWVYRVGVNETLSFLRKKRFRFFLPMAGMEKQLQQSLIADPGISGDRILFKLHQAMLTLPDKQRLVFTMKYFDELTYDEMSEILGTSVGALKASFHFAVKKIEKHLIEY